MTATRTEGQCGSGLTGETPFSGDELIKSGLDEMRRTICEKEPRRPSTRLSFGQSAIDGDLDWIVMKCLEKDPAQRYQTTGDLAAEIDRYLRNEPVIARPPSAAYRLQKFARRHKVALAGALSSQYFSSRASC